MLLAESLFVCVVGVVTALVVLLTAPLWSNAGSRFARWLWHNLSGEEPTEKNLSDNASNNEFRADTAKKLPSGDASNKEFKE